MVHTVQKITGKEFPLKKGTLREGDDARKVSSIEKAKSVLGWQPKRSIEESVNSLVKWYTSHPKGWNV